MIYIKNMENSYLAEGKNNELNTFFWSHANDTFV